MRVFITAGEGDANSAGGMGLARAIRHAYPDAHLTGVSFAPQGTRIQWPDFDDYWDIAPWRMLDLTDHQRAIEERLASGALWLSGLPHETQWLAQTFPSDDRILVPPTSALERVQRELTALTADLGLDEPDTISVTAPDWDLNTFGRRHGWRVWLRTPAGAHQRIANWQALQQACKALGANTGADGIFLQGHIEGTPESLAFAAYQGELLGCTLAIAEETTPTGEWLASRVEEAPAPLMDMLTQTLATLRWTGGGALSLIRASEDRCYVVGWRMGFPEWIFGAALAGKNLPAQLLERVTGETAIAQPPAVRAFARIMVEVPLREPDGAQPTSPHLRQRAPVSVSRKLLQDATPHIPEAIVADVTASSRDLQETPAWLFLPGAARGAFLQAEDLMRRYSTSELRVQVAYSVKTNPERRLLELAQASGLLAETISQAEVKKAIACGFPAERIILNGPAKQWPTSHAAPEPLHAVFCDSLEELRAAVAANETGAPGVYQAKVLGIRLRAPHFASRFGIPVEMAGATETVGALVRQLPGTSRFGVHFHMGSNALGLDHWWRLFNQMLDLAQAIETASGRRVSCLDLGGGWYPDDWADELSPRFEERVIQQVKRALPHVRELFLEPGRMLAQSSMALAVRVLEVRRGADGRIGDVVVDGSIAELAYHNYTIFPHRILWRDPAEQRWRPVGRGQARILGRLCMEKDILSEAVDVPDSLAAGDLFAFCDAGAYDRSMSYSFGQG